MLLIPKMWYLLKLSNCGKIVWLCSGARLLHKKDNTTTISPAWPSPSLATYSQGLWLSHSHTAKSEFTCVSTLCICETKPRVPVFQCRKMCRGSWVFRITQQTCLLQTWKQNCFHLISLMKSYPTMVWARWSWKNVPSIKMKSNTSDFE